MNFTYWLVYSSQRNLSVTLNHVTCSSLFFSSMQEHISSQFTLAMHWMRIDFPDAGWHSGETSGSQRHWELRLSLRWDTWPFTSPSLKRYCQTTPSLSLSPPLFVSFSLTLQRFIYWLPVAPMIQLITGSLIFLCICLHTLTQLMPSDSEGETPTRKYQKNRAEIEVMKHAVVICAQIYRPLCLTEPQASPKALKYNSLLLCQCPHINI